MPSVKLTKVAKGVGGQLIWQAAVVWARERVVVRWGEKVSIALGKLAAECAQIEREEDARVRLGEGFE